MHLIVIWIFIVGCIKAISSDDLLSWSPPAIVYVDRNWQVSSTDPIGTIVTRVRRERHSSDGVTYSLDTNGVPVPFEINPINGVVIVNDTLSDKVYKTYSLWVVAHNKGSIPQRTEVFATITDKNGSTLSKVPHPPKDSTNLLNSSRFGETLSKPKTTSSSPPTTKVTVELEKVSVPETTTLSPWIFNDPKIPEEEVELFENKNNLTATPPTNTDIPLAVIPSVAVGGLVIIVVAVIIFVWKKNSGKKWKKSKKDDLNKDSCGISLQHASLNIWDRPRAYSNRYESWDNSHLQISQETSITTKEEPRDEWEFPRHRLRIFNIVGEGAFGQVFRAQAIDIDGKKGETTVAVKTLKENASQDEKTDLIQELNLMKCLGTHPNVIRLIACCTEKEPILVIMEFVSIGKLQQFLRDSRAERHYGNTHGDSRFLTSSDLTHFAYQVARGMDFLSSKGIIHRDLAARNVLITEERTCKVADFGFARDVTGSLVYERKSGGRLPIRWMAPESLYDDIFSAKSDVWSFGVLLWEIVTLGSTPYPGLSAGDVMQKVRDGYRLEKPEHCRRELYNIMYYCWEADPNSRPDFKEVVNMLERLICTETDYIELERFPDHAYYNVQHLDGEKL